MIAELYAENVSRRLPSLLKVTDFAAKNPIEPWICEKKRIVLEAKQKPCADCGKTYPSCVMDLDHVRGTKYFAASNCARRGITLEMVRAEIAKCDVVCANCHRMRTSKRLTTRTKGVIAA